MHHHDDRCILPFNLPRGGIPGALKDGTCRHRTIYSGLAKEKWRLGEPPVTCSYRLLGRNACGNFFLFCRSDLGVRPLVTVCEDGCEYKCCVKNVMDWSVSGFQLFFLVLLITELLGDFFHQFWLELGQYAVHNAGDSGRIPGGFF